MKNQKLTKYIFNKEKDTNHITITIFGIKMRFRRYISKLEYVEIYLSNIQKKLSMKDDIWRNDNVLFYVPLYPVDLIQNHIVNTRKFFEEEELMLLDKYLSENPVILDIGANIGNHSLYWSIKSSKKAKKIYAFEPIKNTFDILYKNIQINNLQDIVYPYNVGLSDQDGAASIKYFEMENIGGTEISKDSNGSIKLTTLDKLNIIEEKIDFVKIDVEGHEIEVLKGAINTLMKYKPVIFVESFDNNYIEVDKLLRNIGYELEKSLAESNYIYKFQK